MIYTCLFSLIPQRKEGREQSELVNQILFGERFEVIEPGNQWVKVKTCLDQYEGYIDALFLIPNSPLSHLFTNPVTEDYALELAHGKIQITCGALGPKKGEEFSLEDFTNYWLGAPYLWGGKSKMGVDCSGLTQCFLRSRFPEMPRDASKQVLVGNEVPFEQLKSGDLVFFEKSNRITHVGIALNDGKEILHASGFVKIEKLTNEGIWNQNNRCTHVFHSCRRI